MNYYNFGCDPPTLYLKMWKNKVYNGNLVYSCELEPQLTHQLQHNIAVNNRLLAYITKHPPKLSPNGFV